MDSSSEPDRLRYSVSLVRQGIHGSCLCGGVKFEIAGPLTAPLNCHCSQCRKQHGSAFRSRVRVQAKDFRWLHGEHLVKFYESSRGYQRSGISAA
jgi:hypothetical protein